MATKSGPKRPPSWLKELKTNDNLWLRDEEQEWTLGVAEGFADGALQMKMPDGTVRNVKPIDGDIHQANDGVANDMCGLHHINEATILDALQKRSEVQDKRTKAKGGDGVREEMYTYMASVVIAVNPLDGSLTDPQPDIFSKPHERSPHPYDLAETAFKQMCSRTSESGRDQSIVVSGESGSGKTESSKIVLYYLAQRGSSTTAAAGTKTLDKMLLDTNPILEAFGNAKTLRNNNSSRFGKFMKLQFDNTNFQLQGGMVETYLLEKSRVCHQITGERDFHVFYQLLKGCDTDAELATQVCKENADRFDFLKSGGTLEVHGHDDGAHFQEMRSALQTIGVTKETETVLFQLIMAVAHIGNAKFRDEETVEGEKAVPEDDTPLKTAAQLLGVEHEQLSDSILQREIKAMGSTIIKQRNATAAGYARNAVAKELYLRIFDWVVQKVNMSLGQVAAEGNCFIGVLDIFGFESFEVNDFEQLLINFTNEVLQATFNEQVFNAETELYKSEGLEVASVSWPDNRECVELISSTPSGVLSLLDAEAKNPKPKDKKFLSQVHKVHGFNPFCPKPHPKDRDRQFIVRHFAGHVTYTIGNFIDKNNNEVPDDIAKLFAVSKLHNLSDTAATGAPPVPGGRPGAAKKKPTVAAVFKRQMAELVQTLEKTRCSFIRCIKPNAASTVGVFDRKYVTKQLQNQGIVQTAEVLRLGLPTRVKYDIVAQQFRQKLPGEINDIYKHESDQAFVRAIMWAFDVPADTFKCGTTRIFFKVGKMALLDQVLQADLDNADEVARITAKLRRYVQFKRWRRALVKVQAYNVWVRLFEFVAARKSAAIQRIQNMFRQKAARDEYARKQEEAVENKRRDAEEANRVEQQSKREHDSQQRRSKDASLAAIKGNNEARRVADDEVRERAEATETSRRARQKAKEEADAAAREAAEKAAREAEEAQRKKEEEARVAREKAEAEQKRLAEQQAEAQRKEEEAKRQAEEQRKKKEAADAEEEKARKEKEMADQARTEEEAARKASLANAPKEDDKFLEPEPRGARSHNLVGEAEHQALVAGTHQDSDFDADELAETLDMLGVKVTDNDGQPVEQNHPDWQRFAKVALLQAKSKRAEASSNAGTRGSIMPHKSGQGDEEHKSVVRASIRASVAQNTGGTKAKKKVRSNKAAHLLTVNQMSQSGWLDEDQAAQLQQVIMDGADDASFPVDTLKQWGLSLEDLANVLGGEDQVASLKAITEDDDDEEDDGEPEDYTKVYADSLWRVNQLVCPCCSNFNNSKDGNRCKVCGAQMFGHPDLVDAEKGGEKITTDEPDILDDESKLDDEDDDLSKPHCNFKEGILVITVYGSMDTMDHQTLSEYTEYVVMCEWGPPQGDPDRSEKKHWLVAARFSEFKDMHKRLAKRMRQILPQGTDFPKLHKKNMMLQAKKKRVEERQQALQKFWIDLMKLLDSYPQLLAHINELDQFLALSERVTAIKKNILQKQEERKLKAEREGEAETLSMTKQKTFVVRPMNGDMIQQAMYVIEQFTRLVQAAQSDIRYEQDIQHLLRVCLGFLPQLQASATDGPFVDPENITHAEQCLYDLHEATCLYNEEVALFMADG